MILYALPALYALFIWWFSTGVIMYLDGLPRKTFKWSIFGATLLMVFSLWGVWASRNDASVRGAYCAFTCGLLAWGWQEISFYMGYVTGPRKQPCPEGCSGWKHFGHAIQTSLWHELAIIGSGVIIVALTWGSKNQIGMWTFMVLWWMHQSAKLNVFLGVRNLNEEFLPEHLQFLKSFLTKKPMNLLFPVSITISMVILVKLVEAAANSHGSRFDAAGFCFLSVLMGLAIVEHWLLMLPLPAPRKPETISASKGFAARRDLRLRKSSRASSAPARPPSCAPGCRRPGPAPSFWSMTSRASVSTARSCGSVAPMWWNCRMAASAVRFARISPSS
jgi:putative photosynthetic complex assembly protein 2